MKAKESARKPVKRKPFECWAVLLTDPDTGEQWVYDCTPTRREAHIIAGENGPDALVRVARLWEVVR